MSAEDADEFMGHSAPAADEPAVFNVRGRFTLTGEARNVRSFTEDTGWGNSRQTIQIVSFTLDQFESGGLRRSVYAEIRGRSIDRRPLENESITVTGRFYGNLLEVETLAGMRDDPNLPIRPKVSLWRRHRRMIVVLSVVTVLVLVVACVGPLYLFGRIFNDVGAPIRDLVGVGSPPAPIVLDATGEGPWTIIGMGYKYEIVSVQRTSRTPWMGKAGPALMVEGYVTRTDNNEFTAMSFELRNQNGTVLADAGSVWERAPTLGQRLPISLVVYDIQPKASSLTLTISDFYRRDEGLILRGIPVPK
jgi:hypothetical protein